MAMQVHDRPLERWVKEYENDPEFVAEGLATEVIEEVLCELEERGKTQTWLADTMGISRQRVRRMMAGSPNFTFLSFVRLSLALGGTPKVILGVREAS